MNLLFAAALALGFLVSPAAPARRLASQRLATQPRLPSPQLPSHPPAPKAPAPSPRPVPAPPAAASAPPPKPIYFPGHRYDPKRARHDYRVGMLYFHLRQYRGALSRFQGAFRHDPHNWRALYQCGRTASKLRRWPQAERDWRLFLEAFPHSPKAREVRRRLQKIRRQRKAAPRPASL